MLVNSLSSVALENKKKNLKIYNLSPSQPSLGPPSMFDTASAKNEILLQKFHGSLAYVNPGIFLTCLIQIPATTETYSN